MEGELQISKGIAVHSYSMLMNFLVNGRSKIMHVFNFTIVYYSQKFRACEKIRFIQCVMLKITFVWDCSWLICPSVRCRTSAQVGCWGWMMMMMMMKWSKELSTLFRFIRPT